MQYVMVWRNSIIERGIKMGSVGTSNTYKMTSADFKIEEKKWNPRERRNLENALAFMSSEFGDIRDLIGGIYRRTSGTIHASALMDRDGIQGKGRATYFATDNYADESTIIHEFTHAVTGEIASRYKELGYKSERDVLSAMRTEVHDNLGKTERKYDGRKWTDRPEEFLSRHMEVFAKDDYTQTAHKASDEAKETLAVIKKWFRKVGR